MAEDTSDWVKLALAGAALILEQAPHLMDAWRGGDRDEAEAWLRQRENAVRERVRFQGLRDGGT